MADGPANDAPFRLFRDVTFGEGVTVYSFANLYGCSIGDETRVGPFVEIQRGAVIGARCKIQSHTFICDGVTIEDEVFVGHGVMFVNDKTPRATASSGAFQTEDDWELLPTVVERRASHRVGRRRARRRPDRGRRARRCGSSRDAGRGARSRRRRGSGPRAPSLRGLTRGNFRNVRCDP